MAVAQSERHAKLTKQHNKLKIRAKGQVLFSPAPDRHSVAFPCLHPLSKPMLALLPLHHQIETVDTSALSEYRNLESKVMCVCTREIKASSIQSRPARM